MMWPFGKSAFREFHELLGEDGQSMREKFQREQQRREELRLARIRAAEEAAELSKAHRAQLELHEASLQKIIDLRIANREREAKLLERVEKLADGLEQLLARANRDPIP